MCAPRIYAVRAEEIGQALETWGRRRVALVTFTLRHNAAMRLRVLRRVLATAHSEIWGGRAGAQLRTDLDYVGAVRSSEVTHGRNGWHPHLHCLWFSRRTLTAEDWRAVSERWQHVVRRVHERLRESVREVLRGWRVVRGETVAITDSPTERARLGKLWGAAYLKGDTLAHCALEFSRDLATLGTTDELVPSIERGVDVSGVDHTDAYLTKLGLEVASTTKRGRGGSRTHWQVYRDAARGDLESRRLTREHYLAMKGAAMLVWSPGLRARMGLEPERLDETIPQESVAEGERQRLLGEVPSAVWDRVGLRQRHERLSAAYDAFARSALNHVPELSARLLPWETMQRPEHRWRAGHPRPRAPVWWSRLHGPRYCLPPRRERTVGMSFSERQLYLEECRDHLHEELGI